jgi:hypothetical protein
MDTDPQRVQPGIIERSDAQVVIAPRDEYITGAIVGSGRVGFVETGGHAHDHIARAAVQRLAEERFSLRKSEIGNLHIKIFPDERGDLILEALLLVIGIGKVVGISTDAQIGGAEAWKTGSNEHEPPGDT